MTKLSKQMNYFLLLTAILPRSLAPSLLRNGSAAISPNTACTPPRNPTPPVAQPICNGIVALLLLLLLICSQLVMANCVELALIWRITVNYLIDMLCPSVCMCVCVMAFVCLGVCVRELCVALCVCVCKLNFGLC